MKNLIYVNRGSGTIRNKDITEYLFNEISKAILAVYGPGFYAHIYSGGQDRRKRGARRVGSVRHDDYGEGGRAADIYVYNKEKVKLRGEELAPLVQYWLAKNIGGVGIEMAVGGVHLDQWAKPPTKRSGMFWYYDYGKGTAWRKVQQEAIRNGLSGVMPTLYEPPMGFIESVLAGIFELLGRKRT